jgi:protein-disulfide isomerase
MAKRRVRSRAARARAQRAQIALIAGMAAVVLLFVVVIGAALSQSGFNLLGGGGLATTSYAQIPQTTTAEGAPILGNPDAQIMVMEFADYSCSHCGEYHDSTVKPLIDTYVRSGKIRFVFQTETFVGQQYSEYAGQAALCAGQQGHFWEMQDALFQLEQSPGVLAAFNESGIRAAADNLKLDTNKLIACINSGTTKPSLASSAALGSRLGVSGTPTMFISTDGGKTFNFMTDSQGQPISAGGPAFETIAENIQRASQSASR